MTTYEDRFTTTHLGNLFLLRLAAFVQERKARLLDIDEQSADLEVGGRSVGDWFFGRDYIERTRIQVRFLPCQRVASADPTERLDVSVTIAPVGGGSREFPEVASYFMRDLRGFFAAV